MSLWVQILAVGPFRRDVAELLQYPPEFYESTTDGSTVIVDLFGIGGNHVGREFAAQLGITDVWNFAQHKIDPDRADLVSLRSLLGSLGEDKYLYDLERFERLRDVGFDFYFRPNG